jgi:hypothetical protein
LAHEVILSFARQAARRASEQGDDGTNDLIVSDLIRLNEKQALVRQRTPHQPKDSAVCICCICNA